MFIYLFVAVFDGSKHCRYRYSIQISWISLCTNPIIKYHCSYVSGSLASLPSFPCRPCNLSLVSGKIEPIPEIFLIMQTQINFEAQVFKPLLQAYYITTARELARMVGIQKGPILHHFSESVSGAATIRCFNQEKLFVIKILNLIDDYSRVAFHNFAAMEWLSVRINFLFNIVFFLVLIILVTLPRSAIDPSKLFLSLCCCCCCYYHFKLLTY